MKGPLRSWRRKALQSIFEAGESLRLQFPLEDLGFCYSSPGAATCTPCQAAGGPQAPGQSAAQNLRSQQGRGLEYVQNTELGSRLPHCEIRLMRSEQQHSHRNSSARGSPHQSQQVSQQVYAEGSSVEAYPAKNEKVDRLDDSQHGLISTHDLLDSSSTALTLLLGPGNSAPIWAAAAQDINKTTHILRIAQLVDSPGPGQGLQACDSLEDLPVSVAEDVTGRWKALRQVGLLTCCHHSCELACLR